MIYLWATILVLVNAGWLVLTVLTLPGNWLMVATTVAVAWWQWGKGMFHPATLAAIALLAAGGEALEVVSSAGGARRAGGTRWASIGSLVGALAGALAGTFLIPVPLLGPLIGACAGACLGALGLELMGGRGARQSIRSGLGAGIGRLLAAVAKIAVGVVIWVIVAVAAFWP